MSNDIRDMLSKIRQLQESENKISMTELNDVKEIIKETKRPSFLIAEQEEEEPKEYNVIRPEDDEQHITPEEKKEEEQKFKDSVSGLVRFDDIKVYPENVEWSGYLIREKIQWVFSLDDTVGCFIDTDELFQLRDENMMTLKKLRGYYDIWQSDWSGRLTGSGSRTSITPPPEQPEGEAGAAPAAGEAPPTPEA